MENLNPAPQAQVPNSKKQIPKKKKRKKKSAEISEISGKFLNGNAAAAACIKYKLKIPKNIFPKKVDDCVRRDFLAAFFSCKKAIKPADMKSIKWS